MLSSTLWWNGSNRALDDLQKCLLYTFTRYVSCDRYILRLLCNLIDLINIDNTMLCTLDIIIGCLNQLQ